MVSLRLVSGFSRGSVATEGIGVKTPPNAVGVPTPIRQ